MTTSLNNHLISPKAKSLSLTVGITTCFGDASILNTVKSIRSSKRIRNFRFIIVSDRVKFNNAVKKEFKKYGIEHIENKNEASQIEKQKQILKIVKSDLLVLTQDDVLLDPNALAQVVLNFRKNNKLTMVSILNKPTQATNLFEDILNIGTNIANKTAKNWKNGNNYLSVIGRFMVFRTDFIKHKFRLLSEVATSDAYYYFENKRAGGKYKYLSDVYVEFKNPQNIKEHMRKSSRFQYSNMEMSHYFKNINREYEVPYLATAEAVIDQLIQEPVKTVLYFGVFAYTRILKLKSAVVLNPIWEVDLSTKNISVFTKK